MASLVGLPLAFLGGLQALSLVTTKNAPEAALSILGSNGLAQEKAAVQRFAAQVAEGQDLPVAAQSVLDLAVGSMTSEPLLPDAHAIIAMAETNETRQRALINAASKLNRRDLALQTLVLQDRIAQQSYAGTVETLDQILRVHPERSAEYFPVLVEALTYDRAIPEFADILDGSSPWHQRFLNHAVRQTEALENLAVLRRRLTIGEEAFDRLLISGLAAGGNLETARAVFNEVGRTADSSAPNSLFMELDWSANYPPFDWRLINEPGFRGQVSREGDELTISVRPGKGGVIAARMLAAPSGPFEVDIDFRVSPENQARDIRLQLICVETQSQFFDERFSSHGNGFAIDTVPAGCEQMLLAINARAWTGRSPLNATIQQIAIRPR